MMRTFKEWNELFPRMKIDSCKTTTAGCNDVFTAVKNYSVYVCVSGQISVSEAIDWQHKTE